MSPGLSGQLYSCAVFITGFGGGVDLCSGLCFRAVFVTQPVSGMATGSCRPDADRQSREVPILQRTQRVGVTLGSPELYNVDPECVPDLLGLHARRPEAPVVKVMLGCDSQCIRVLIPDDEY